MNTLNPLSTAALVRATPGFQGPTGLPKPPGQSKDPVAAAQEVKAAFTQFVGGSVFGQMLGAMRKTVGEPAYFHGGRAEEVFQSQLDQAIADELTASGGSNFAEGLFSQQFPREAATLKEHERQQREQQLSLDSLSTLRRR